MKNVLNVKPNSELATVLKGHEQGDKIETRDLIIKVESIKHTTNVK